MRQSLNILITLLLAFVSHSETLAKSLHAEDVQSGITKSGVHYTTIKNDETEKNWLALIHGFTHDQRFYSKQLSHFKKSFNLLLVDYRGHGKSSNKAGPFGFEEYADDVLDVIDSLNIKKLNYWGSHTGATIGLLIGIRRPKLIESFILEGGFANDFPMPDVSKTYSRAARIAKQIGPKQAIEDWFLTGAWFKHIHNSGDKDWIRQHKEITTSFQGAPWLSNLKARNNSFMSGKLSKLTQPVALIIGEHDSVEFISASENLLERLPNAIRYEIKDAGGFATWERPTAVSTIVKRFIRLNFDTAEN